MSNHEQNGFYQTGVSNLIAAHINQEDEDEDEPEDVELIAEHGGIIKYNPISYTKSRVTTI